MADWSMHSDGQRYQTLDRPEAGPLGTTLTGGATAHVKGSWTPLTAPTDFDATWLALTVHGLQSATSPPAVIQAMIDLAVGAAASEVVVLENLYWSQAALPAAQDLSSTLLVPLAVPAGTALSARMQTVAGAPATLNFSATLLAGGWAASAPSQVAETWGATTAGTTGVNLTPGVGVYGSWEDLTTSSARKADWLVLDLVLPGSFPAAGYTHHYVVDIGVGAAASEVVLIPALPVAFDSNGVATLAFSPALPVAIPAGTRVAARVSSPSAGPNIHIVAHAFGG